MTAFITSQLILHASSVLSGHLVLHSYLLNFIFLGPELGKFVFCQCHILKLIQGLGQWLVVGNSALRSAGNGRSQQVVLSSGFTSKKTVSHPETKGVEEIHLLIATSFQNQYA